MRLYFECYPGLQQEIRKRTEAITAPPSASQQDLCSTVDICSTVSCAPVLNIEFSQLPLAIRFQDSRRSRVIAFSSVGLEALIAS